jgi:alpha-glucosidase
MKALFITLSYLIYIIPAYAQTTASKNVSTFTISAPQLKTQKKIWVYLPEGYAASRKKYPVIYMHDAQNLFDKSTSYSGEWRVDETLDSLHAQTIVVGIEHGNEKRIDELTPYKNAKYGGGNTAAYLDFIVTTLKPHIDSLYRTKPERKHTTIFGSSLGGLVSFYAVLKYPDVFGKAGIFSPAFWINNEIYELAKDSKIIKVKLYFMCGDNEDKDMVPDMQEMIAYTKEIVCEKCLTEKIIPEGKHNEKLWANQFAEAYLWLME